MLEWLCMAISRGQISCMFLLLLTVPRTLAVFHERMHTAFSGF